MRRKRFSSNECPLPHASMPGLGPNRNEDRRTVNQEPNHRLQATAGRARHSVRAAPVCFEQETAERTEASAPFPLRSPVESRLLVPSYASRSPCLARCRSPSMSPTPLLHKRERQTNRGTDRELFPTGHLWGPPYLSDQWLRGLHRGFASGEYEGLSFGPCLC